jgi:hypothetical protein
MRQFTRNPPYSCRIRPENRVLRPVRDPPPGLIH